MKFTKNAMRYGRGFTLIELLVVIAIIGILSSIVLASLATARSSANNSKIEEQMNSLRNSAEIYNSANGGYATTVFATSTIPLAMAAASSSNFLSDANSGGFNVGVGIMGTSGVGATKVVIQSSYWGAAVTLPYASGNIAAWCADSTGKSEGITSAQYTAALGATLCP